MVDKAGVGFGPSILWIAWGLFQIGGASDLKSNISFERGGACFERNVWSASLIEVKNSETSHSIPGGGGRRKATWLPVDTVTIQTGCLVSSGKHFGYCHAQRT